MEYWNDESKGRSRKTILAIHSSIIPILHYSVAPSIFLPLARRVQAKEAAPLA